MEEHDSIDLRSKAFQEVLGEPPSWLLRWGISAILLAFVALFVVGYFLEYPETVKSPVRLETSNPPVEVTAQIVGTVKPSFAEQSSVIQNAVIAKISNVNSGNFKEIIALDKMLLDFEDGKLRFPNFQEMNNWNFGPIEGDYIKFYQAFIGTGGSSSLQNQTISSYDENIKIFEKDIDDIKKIVLKKESRYAKIPTERDGLKEAYAKSKLGKDRLNLNILYQEETRLIEEIKVENQRISDKQREIINLKNQKSLFLQGIQGKKLNRQQDIEFTASTLRSKIEAWKVNHLIRAPISGKIVYQDKLKANTEVFLVDKGEKIFAIIPENAQDTIEGKLYLSSEEFIKIKKGQEVKIKISAFNPAEYGLLHGVIIDKAAIPVNNQYLVRVNLANGMKTSKDKLIPFEHQMQGEAEIITEDRRFTDLILKQFKEMLSR